LIYALISGVAYLINGRWDSPIWFHLQEVFFPVVADPDRAGQTFILEFLHYFPTLGKGEGGRVLVISFSLGDTYVKESSRKGYESDLSNKQRFFLVIV
jgi:hypothetical protein